MRLVKPRALRPGDCIGIVSTSSPVAADELDRPTAYLGCRVEFGLGGHRPVLRYLEDLVTLDA